MSVIIRLQNLPWSANAVDIRGFFRGLSIPDGGVHIVGGENGDAFIAFSTDEDARRAMMLDRGKIKEIQIRLLLSSRAEMQKVIEVARQSSLSMMQISSGSNPPIIKTQQPQNQMPSAMQQHMMPQPPVITPTSLKNILSQQQTHSNAALGFNDSPIQSYHTYVTNVGNDNSLDSRDSRDKSADQDRSRRGRSRDRYDRSSSRSNSRDRHRSNSRDRGRRRRSRSRDRRDRRRRRSRDRSRDRDRDDYRERDRDRGNTDYRERDRDRDTRDRERDRDSRRDRGRPGRGNDNKDNSFGDSDKPMVIADDDDANGVQQPTRSAIAGKTGQINIWEPPQQPVFQTNLAKNYSTTSSNNNSTFMTNNQAFQANKTNTMVNQGLPTFMSQQPPLSFTANQQQNSQQQQQNILGSLPMQQSLQTNANTPFFNQMQSYQTQAQPKGQNLDQKSSLNLLQQQPPQLNLGLNKPTRFGSSMPLFSTMNLSDGNMSQSTDTKKTNTLLLDRARSQLALQNPYTMASTRQTSQQAAANKPAFTGLTSFSGIFNIRNQEDDGTSKSEVDDEKSKGPHDKDILRPPKKSPEFKDPADINYDEIEGNCIRISNMCSSTSYSELRRFFSGLYIANNGIKMINDEHGLRIGMAYVRFVRRESKPKAFTRSGLTLKSKRVIIDSVTEDEFEQAIDSFKPVKNSRTSRFSDADDADKKDTKLEDDDKDDEAPYTVLQLKDLPPFSKEQDIIKMFSSYSLMDIVLIRDGTPKKFVCYVKFHRPEDAKLALREKGSHMIGHKQIYVLPSTQNDLDEAKMKNTIDDVDQVEEEPMDEDNANDAKLSANTYQKDRDPDQDGDDGDDNNEDPDTRDSRDQINDNISENHSNQDRADNTNYNSNDTKSNIPSLFSIKPSGPGRNMAINDPRRRGTTRSRFDQPTDSQEKTHYAILRNCDYKSSQHDFANFLSTSGVVPNRIQILYNQRNQPSGECIIEFKTPEDAEKSLAKNNTYCGSRSVRIELIPPIFVANRLGETFMRNAPSNMNANNNTNNSNSFNNRMFPQEQNHQSQDDNGFNSKIQDHILNFIASRYNNNMNRSMEDDNNSSSRNSFRGEGMGLGGNSLSNDNFDRNDGSGGGRRTGRMSRFADLDNGSQSMMRGGSNGGTGMGGRFGHNNNQNSNNNNNNIPTLINDSMVDNFGQPGCVISMENVPYKAGIDDILQFFGKFNVQPQNVIRRYTDDGSPTGDARIAFSNPMEARAAMETKRLHKIFNRTIFLNIL